jgi:hypothetical protein
MIRSEISRPWRSWAGRRSCWWWRPACRRLAELIRYARDNPGKLAVAAANPPTIFAMAQLRTREKLDIASKDYPIDAAAMKAILEGQAHIMAAGLNNAMEHIKEGRLRAIATLGASRARLAPRCLRPPGRRPRSSSASRSRWLLQ